MPEVKGWTYGHSDLLEMNFACKVLPNGRVDAYTEDKTHYTQSELDIINNDHQGEYDKRVHMIKHVFNGVIVS